MEQQLGEVQVRPAIGAGDDGVYGPIAGKARYVRSPSRHIPTARRNCNCGRVLWHCRSARGPVSRGALPSLGWMMQLWPQLLMSRRRRRRRRWAYDRERLAAHVSMTALRVIGSGSTEFLDSPERRIIPVAPDSVIATNTWRSVRKLRVIAIRSSIAVYAGHCDFWSLLRFVGLHPVAVALLLLLQWTGEVSRQSIFRLAYSTYCKQENCRSAIVSDFTEILIPNERSHTCRMRARLEDTVLLLVVVAVSAAGTSSSTSDDDKRTSIRQRRCLVNCQSNAGQVSVVQCTTDNLFQWLSYEA